MSEIENATLEDLKTLVATLTDRVDQLESELREIHNPDEVKPEVVLAIAAACAAYLGKRATVKQVRLRRGSAWASQGRSAIQHSHAIAPGVR